MAGSAGQHPAPDKKVLLLTRAVQALDLYRTATGNSGPLCTKELPVERVVAMAHACAGGRAGSRLACKLGLLATRSTLLRELRQRPASPLIAPPRVLGIDEWAWKKGHRYGTILYDLERGKVIDLLPTRDISTVAAWLAQHSTIEVVSRDRASSFAPMRSAAERLERYRLQTAGTC